jgi:DNA-binding PadR family transcriptional regulator
LLALSLKERHGYELMQQVEEDSEGVLKIGPGALYGAIRQLCKAGFIEEVKDEQPQRRRYYHLTQSGRQRLQAELRYFENSLKLGKKRQALGDHIGYGLNV